MSVQMPSGGYRGNGKYRYTKMAEINVTPFVDVMLVLLIVFMVTAPLLTVGVPVDLPKTRAATINDSEEPLVVTIDAAGKIYLQETAIPLETGLADIYPWRCIPGLWRGHVGDGTSERGRVPQGLAAGKNSRYQARQEVAFVNAYRRRHIRHPACRGLPHIMDRYIAIVAADDLVGESDRSRDSHGGRNGEAETASETGAEESATTARTANCRASGACGRAGTKDQAAKESRAQAETEGRKKAETETEKANSETKAAPEGKTEAAAETQFRIGIEDRKQAEKTRAAGTEKEKARAAATSGEIIEAEAASNPEFTNPRRSFGERIGSGQAPDRTLLEPTVRRARRRKDDRRNSCYGESGWPGALRLYCRQSAGAKRCFLSSDGGKRIAGNIKSSVSAAAIAVGKI
jgi:hypothetical protein